MLPLGCFPLWGREGVILQAAAENNRDREKRVFQQSKYLIFFQALHVQNLPFFYNSSIL